MSVSTPNTTPYVAIENAAWYWLWSGALCLLLVPAAWAWSTTWGWLPYWLVGAPLVIVAGIRVLAWSQATHAHTLQHPDELGLEYRAVTTAPAGPSKAIPPHGRRRRVLLAAMLSR
jgi:hypothetical protein